MPEFLAAGEAYDGVAAFDVVVQKVEWLAGDVRLEPQRDLAKLDGERVDVDAVNAVADDGAQGGTVGRRRGLLFAGAHYRQLGSDPARGSKQHVAGAAGDVGYPQIKQGGFGIIGLETLVDQVVERVAD